MKSVFLKLFLITILFTMAGCKSQKLNPDMYQRQWMLVSHKDYTKEFLSEKGAYLDMSPTKSPPNQYRAYMGCNSLFVTIEIDSEGGVKTGDMGSTEMYCEDNKGLEKSFLYEIGLMTKMKVDGHYMTLSNDAGKTMKFVAADWD